MTLIFFLYAGRIALQFNEKVSRYLNFVESYEYLKKLINAGFSN